MDNLFEGVTPTQVDSYCSIKVSKERSLRADADALLEDAWDNVLARFNAGRQRD